MKRNFGAINSTLFFDLPPDEQNKAESYGEMVMMMTTRTTNNYNYNSRENNIISNGTSKDVHQQQQQHNNNHENDTNLLLNEMYDLISQCEREEQEASIEFGNIVAQNAHTLDIQLNNIDEIRYQINNAEQRANTLSSSITSVYRLAEGVSSKVRQLHLIQSRVKQAVDAIEGNIGMKSCLQGVEEALRDEDYERATHYVSRVHYFNEQQKQKKEKMLNIDSNEQRETADQASESDSISNIAVLQDSELKIRTIVKSKFQESVKDGNVADIHRFAKLFAPLRMEKEGLIIYTQYLVEQARTELEELVNDNLERVADLTKYDQSEEDESDNEDFLHSEKPADEDDMITYVDLLRLALDIIAGTFESNEEFIANNFGGRDKIVYTLQALQQMCEKISYRIFTSFIKKRGVDETKKAVEQIMTSVDQQSRHPSTRVGQKDDTVAQVPEPRVLDLLLEEMAALCSITERYERYIQSKVKVATSNIESPEYTFPRISNISTKMQEIMSTYILLDEYFMQQGITKAIQLNRAEMETMYQSSRRGHSRDGGLKMDFMGGEYIDGEEDMFSSSDEQSDHMSSDEDEGDDSQKCSTLVDDTFFILQKSLSRCVTSNSVSVVCAILNHMNTILTGIFQDDLNKYIGMMNESQKRMNRNNEYSYIHESSARIKQEMILLKIILIALNNLEISSSYVIKLKQEFEKMCEHVLKSDDKSEKMKLKSCAMDFVDTSLKFQTSVDRNMKRLVQLRLDQIINESLDNLNHAKYVLSDQDYNNGHTAQFIDILINYIDTALHIYQKNLTRSNFDKLIQEILLLLTPKIEQLILRKKFNQFGAWQFDKDIRVLMLYFSGKTQMTIRDKFARLTQMAFLLKMTSPEEVLDYWGEDATSMSWRLSQHEIRSVLSLREDFDASTIQSLAL